MTRAERNTIREEVDEGSWWYITRGPLTSRPYSIFGNEVGSSVDVEDRRYTGCVVRVLSLEAWPNVLVEVLWDDGNIVPKVRTARASAGPLSPQAALKHNFATGKPASELLMLPRAVLPFKNILAKQVSPEWVAALAGCQPGELNL